MEINQDRSNKGASVLGGGRLFTSLSGCGAGNVRIPENPLKWVSDQSLNQPLDFKRGNRGAQVAPWLNRARGWASC